MKRVAVEKRLSDVTSYLKKEGLDVTEFDTNKKSSKNFLNKFEAVVVTGQDNNFLGMEDTITKASIINVDGMTPEEVKNQINNIK